MSISLKPVHPENCGLCSNTDPKPLTGSRTTGPDASLYCNCYMRDAALASAFFLFLSFVVLAIGVAWWRSGTGYGGSDGFKGGGDHHVRSSQGLIGYAMAHVIVMFVLMVLWSTYANEPFTPTVRKPEVYYIYSNESYKNTSVPGFNASLYINARINSWQPDVDNNQWIQRRNDTDGASRSLCCCQCGSVYFIQCGGWL